MDVIPVVDLVGGMVVRARMGDRDAYRPITTALSPTSDPIDVVGGLLSLRWFSTLYAADLDAIQRKGDNLSALRCIRAAFPSLRMWVDNGASDEAALEAILEADLGAPVIGSEFQRDCALLASHRDSPLVVLSLDFRDEAFQGPRCVLSRPQLWPHRIIVMTLTRVGSGTGPDLARIAAIRSIAGPREIYAAGGVRDAEDLAALKFAGVAGVLVASALHNGRVTGADLADLESM